MKYPAKFPAYNVLGLKSYTTKTSMTGNWFQCILLIMLLGKTLFFIQILVSKLLYCISFLLIIKRNFPHISYTPSCIGSQFLWFNNYITINNNSVHFKEFSSHNINFINQLFTSEGEFKNWNPVRREFQLTYSLSYKVTQISKAIPKIRKQIIRENRAETCAICLDHHLITIYFSVWKKLISRELHSILISKKMAYPLHSSIYSQVKI